MSTDIDRTNLGPIEIQRRFGEHVRTETSKSQVEETSYRFREFAAFLDRVLPEGRAKSIAMTELETAQMWVNKAIAEQTPVAYG